MRKIYGIWFVRRMLPILALETAVIGAVALFMQGFIKYGHLINNTLYRWSHHPVSNMGSFWLEAFMHTELVMKALLAATVVVLGLLARDAFRTVRRMGGNFLATRRVTY